MPKSKKFTVPVRIIVPIVAALLCVSLLVAFLWWQLTKSASLIKLIPESVSPSGIQTITTTAATGDEVLTALRQGDLLALRGDWKGAEAQYQIAVDQDGGLPALRKLAQAQLQRRDTNAVHRTINLLRLEGAKEEDLLLLESIVDLREGEVVRTRTRLQNADDSPHKHYGLALLSIVEGNHDQAKIELDAVINGWEPVLRSNANALKSAYDEYALFPESPQIHLVTLLSRALAQVQECELAIPLLVRVTNEQDDYRDAWIVLGYCELTTERPEQAIQSLEQAYALDPGKPEVQYFLGRAYAATGDSTNALTFLEYAVANGFQPETDARRAIAEQAVKLGNGQLALQQYEILSEDENADIEIFAGFIEAAIALKQPEEAYIKAQQAVQRWPETARAYKLLGDAATAADHDDDAEQAYAKAKELDPFLEVK